MMPNLLKSINEHPLIRFIDFVEILYVGLVSVFIPGIKLNELERTPFIILCATFWVTSFPVCCIDSVLISKLNHGRV